MVDCKTITHSYSLVQRVGLYDTVVLLSTSSTFGVATATRDIFGVCHINYKSDANYRSFPQGKVILHPIDL